MRPGFWLGQTQRPTAPQKAVQQHIARRCACFLQKLQSRDTPNFGSCDSFQHFESKPSSKYPAMQAEKVDLPARAATCDPEKLLPPELADSVMDVEKMFPFCMPMQPGPVGPEGAERAEYVKLVFRQLQCGKTLLRLQCKAIGDVFCVAKSHGKQREVWNGSLISQVAARPPGPAKLANPSCFVDLCFKPGEQVYMSKRDVQTFFDVLQAPQHLQKWFGRPPVSLHELAHTCAVSFDKLLEYVACEDRVDISPLAPLYPTSTVWPMGFSWSSCVAQACTIACCSKAGVQDNAFMTLDCPPPVGVEVCGVATDDTFFFHKDKLLGTERLEQLDRVLEEQGMPKNAAKDVTLESEMTALGCELTAQPPAAEPSTAKLVQLYKALLDVFILGRASPTAVSRALGVEQWFCLLNRPMFSIFDAVYEFVRREPAGQVQTLPHKVLAEFLVAACLSPLLGADLGRDFLTSAHCLWCLVRARFWSQLHALPYIPGERSELVVGEAWRLRPFFSGGWGALSQRQAWITTPAAFSQVAISHCNLRKSQMGSPFRPSGSSCFALGLEVGFTVLFKFPSSLGFADWCKSYTGCCQQRPYLCSWHPWHFAENWQFAYGYQLPLAAGLRPLGRQPGRCTFQGCEEAKQHQSPKAVQQV